MTSIRAVFYETDTLGKTAYLVGIPRTQTTTRFYDIGQVLDSSGNPTNTFVSWQSLGEVWSPSQVASQTVSSAGIAGKVTSPIDIVTVGGVDYAVDFQSKFCVALNGSTVKAFANFPSWSTWGGVVLPHAGALLIWQGSSPTAWNISFDAGQTWTNVTGAPTSMFLGTGSGNHVIIGSLLQRH